ncbi:hypothetical protein ACN2MM_04580 [Alkalilimnicola ehrlichii MLHE-1]|uniref:Uncharacterized protein n=1 Tax=Alkalilimnicola ehrlichii (strain ATCC BAA-1101 / DSM 17681 / MLHE-1) TaxID=187272 RepID=Q0AAJ1_ALKEH|nr:hypothetical protein [Alkalilimnicola ehrlichii]ABI56146.1 hypothetical protein Mlg_0792 [Alkalilimnicola ehrlichii MLHE-1]
MGTTTQGKPRQIPRQYSNDWLERLDGRTAIAKAVNDRLHHLVRDLGGPDALSYQEQSICRRIVWLEAQIESREVALAKGEDVDEARHVANINTLTGLLKAVGLERRSKDVPDLAQYLASKEAG